MVTNVNSELLTRILDFNEKRIFLCKDKTRFVCIPTIALEYNRPIFFRYKYKIWFRFGFQVIGVCFKRNRAGASNGD